MTAPRRPPGPRGQHDRSSLRAGVLFDVDGTLADSNYLHTLAWSRALAELGEWAPSDAVRKLLACDDVIDAVTSSDDVDASKPSPDIFEAALKAGSVDPRRAIVVGDSVWGVRAARRAGLGCVGVETGGFSSHELDEEGALHVYRDVEELARQLHTSPLSTLIAR